MGKLLNLIFLRPSASCVSPKAKQATAQSAGLDNTERNDFYISSPPSSPKQALSQSSNRFSLRAPATLKSLRGKSKPSVKPLTKFEEKMTEFDQKLAESHAKHPQPDSSYSKHDLDPNSDGTWEAKAIRVHITW